KFFLIAFSAKIERRTVRAVGPTVHASALQTAHDVVLGQTVCEDNGRRLTDASISAGKVVNVAAANRHQTMTGVAQTDPEVPSGQVVDGRAIGDLDAVRSGDRLRILLDPVAPGAPLIVGKPRVVDGDERSIR